MSKDNLPFQTTSNKMSIGRRPTLLIHTSNNEKAATLLRGYPLRITSEGLYMPYVDDYQTAMINRELVAIKLDVYVLQTSHPDLGEWFSDPSSPS
jgi:hypothetical protein